ncbi:hypothetical protein Forpe1208_v015302 [Fusarium oxysporum f. sp. rapae]|uniref:Uncharacterized protein n=1 Tax=Fusarium oxysporum f. sp. rapae TaxID=485398 RepID=A0A8J5NIM7_FUSOX|nr:hypothetical protein Forpe1208_v015302 [Fusarium oxysporum f. sp. rapae]
MSQGDDPKDNSMTGLRIKGMSSADSETLGIGPGSPSSLSDKETLASGSRSQTQPGTADNTASVTASSSSSLGADVGFSGVEPAGGASISYTPRQPK